MFRPGPTARRAKEFAWYVRQGVRQLIDEAQLFTRGLRYAMGKLPDISDWEPIPATPLRRRRYRSDEEYVTQQISKFPLIKQGLRDNSEARRRGFYDRFAACPEILAAQSVLCLGVRTGEEVRALWDHGVLAVGIDLLPGDDRFVLRGNFQALELPDQSFDAVYCNALDHAADLEAVAKEVDRLLRHGKALILDIADGYEEGRSIGPYEALSWPFARDVADEVVKMTGYALDRFQAIRLLQMDGWNEAVFRKPLDPTKPHV